jgi:hypothetical protein
MLQAYCDAASISRRTQFKITGFEQAMHGYHAADVGNSFCCCSAPSATEGPSSPAGAAALLQQAACWCFCSFAEQSATQIAAK